ncbi:hypothetical protein [Methyloceanibacter marginalis]|jgi:hypothetical protein|uniref:hypothetical protein n=1 Tax=Methyloceanibacter marginalis TaxID=1774971 RepID=UPI00130178EF|nr:hypothetical protein [Methyloceanibacter marginalis]
MPLAYSPVHGPGGHAAIQILAVQILSESNVLLQSDVLPENDVRPKANLDLKLVAVLRN